MRSRSAFTLVEVMIIVVIAGLLAAMAIPAIQKIREGSLLKAVERGERLTPDQRKRYAEIRGRKPHFSAESPVETGATQSVATAPFQRVEIDGHTFYLIPKYEVKETEIAGKTFWLVPTQ